MAHAQVLKNCVLLLIVAGLLAVPAVGASFGIRPNSVTIDANTPVAEFTLSSLSAHPTIFEVHVSQWLQTPQDDSYAPQTMMIVPAVFKLSPYETRLIRIEPRGGTEQDDIEHSYRVTITEVVPGQPSPPPAAHHFDAVFFIPPRSSSGEATFALSGSGKNAQLTVANTSNRHIYLGQPRIEVDGKEVYRGPTLGYVLAGSTRVFPLTLTITVEQTGATFRFDDENGSSKSAPIRVSR